MRRVFWIIGAVQLLLLLVAAIIFDSNGPHAMVFDLRSCQQNEIIFVVALSRDRSLHERNITLSEMMGEDANQRAATDHA